ncbi:phosphotransferase [Paenibacillus qinlingensis]|uniref:Aminoglycoside phosphotransferase domain-containing protein n=1 Tax=Paenibacillus qinlingensis TaxID=1837343 RepID=A0ABU1NQA4_9BACL|nr:phosphotransferase [Paenibacillus qinlingensis]MDR6549197.1 hypothetical protein [Paenibacillus qinlingensis]
MVAMNEHIFLESGRVRDDIPHEREVIYVGRNGQKVERIQVEIEGAMISFIFKPLTNYPNKGKELWVQEHISYRIPEVRIPRIMYSAQAIEPEKEWMVFEDLGELEHSFRADMLIKTSELMPYWHRLPTSLLPQAFEGHSPKLTEIQRFIQVKGEQIKQLWLRHGFQDEHMTYFLAVILPYEHLESETVISHGDLYPLNLTEVNNQSYILDWEYIHINSVFWDLYNLMDITSPQYSRLVIQQESRLDILERYMAVRSRLHFPTKEGFIRDYHSFSALYSMWLLLLIEDDIAQGKFEETALKRQYNETLEIFRIVLLFLIDTRGQNF